MSALAEQMFAAYIASRKRTGNAPNALTWAEAEPWLKEAWEAACEMARLTVADQQAQLKAAEEGAQRDVKVIERLSAAVDRVDGPIPMHLWCPSCGTQHFDVGEFATRPHKIHTCQNCGACWMPCLKPTVGVKFLPGTDNGATKPESVHAVNLIRTITQRGETELVFEPVGGGLPIHLTVNRENLDNFLHTRGSVE